MPRLSRRTFFAWLGAALGTVAVSDRLEGAVAAVAAAGLDPALLRALAGAILPAEIGADGATRAADAFHDWVAGYRPGAELLHDYGVAKISRAGPSPMLRWGTQLARLDRAARARHGASLGALSAGRRRALVADALAGDAVATDLPGDPARARHVAVGLLAHFYMQPEAIDLAYGAEIGAMRCRPLAKNPERPVPLRRRAGA
ncbi:MAG TPA: hypothetical protein VFJ74_17435 [Gemmatimonadaceae bacterium]|nr:hypothetical protein [Gemmatimonadaceae bacterium]